MKLSYLSLFVLSFHMLCSQEVIIRSDSLSENEMIRHISELEDGNLMYIKFTGPLPSGNGYLGYLQNLKSTLVVTNSSLQEINSKEILSNEPHIKILAEEILEVNDHILLYGNALDTISMDTQLMFMWLDLDLNITEIRYYGDEAQEEACLFYCINDKGNYVFAGSYPIWSQNEKLVFFEVDRQGKLVTSEHTSQIIYSPDIVFLEKDQLYIVGEKFSISKYDKDYNLISTIIPELYNCFFPFGAPLRINDSLYFRTGSDSSPVYPHLKEITRAVFNADAEYTDYYQISIPEYLDIPAQRYAISESGAQQYFLGGTSNSTGIPFETVDTRFALQKFDLSGNIFWENTYETGGNAVMIQVLALEDGGCLMAGQIYNWHQNPEQQLDLIFMKVDDNGIVTRIEENSNSGNQVYVYPNPGSNHLYFSTHQEIKRFVMYDINGRMVLDQCFPDEMLDVSFLFNGFYFWEMETKEGLILNGKWIKGR